MSNQHILSDTLKEAAEILDAHVRDDIPVPPHRAIQMAQTLRLQADLARAKEHELSVFRLKEAGKLGQQTMGDLATRAMEEALVQTDGNVIKPNFGGKE